MRRYLWLLPLMTVIFSASFSVTYATCMDEPPALTETLQSADNTLDFQYPAGWIVHIEPFGGVRLANIETVISGGIAEECDLLVLLYTPFQLQSQLGVHSSQTLTEQVLRLTGFALLDQMNTDGSVATPPELAEETTIGGNDAAIARVTTETMDAFGVIIRLEDGSHMALVAISNAGEMQDFEAFLLVMAEALSPFSELTSNGELLLIAHGENSNNAHAIWNHEETQILSAMGNTARVWDAATGAELFTLHHGDMVISAVWSPDETKILTQPATSGSMVWDAKTGELISILSIEGTPSIALYTQWSADSLHVYTVAIDLMTYAPNLCLWDAETGEQLRCYGELITPVLPIILNSDETKLISLTARNILTVWDTVTGDELLTLTHTEDVQAAAWSPDATLIVAREGSYPNPMYLSIWNASSGELLHTISSDSSTFIGAVWNSDSTLLLGWTFEAAYVIEAVSGETLLTLQNPDASRSGTSNEFGGLWNDDGTQLMTWSADYVDVWDVGSGELLHSLDISDISLTSVSWSPDHQRLMVWTNSGMALIWDLASDELVATFEHNESVVSELYSAIGSAYWSADGNRVLTAYSDGTVRVWEVPAGE